MSQISDIEDLNKYENQTENMKKFLFAAALAAVSLTGYADDTTKSNDFTEEVYYNDSKGYSVQTNSFWKNWHLSIGAGAQTLFGDHDKQLKWGDRITPAFDIALGKWFTPVIGVRGMVSGLTLKGGAQDGDFLQSSTDDAAFSTGEVIGDEQFWQDHHLWQQKFNYINGHIDVMINMTNLFCGFKEERVYNAIPYFGLGWVAALEDADRLPEGASLSREVGANIGLVNQFRLCRNFDLNIDIRGGYVNDRFDGEVGGRYGEGVLSTTANLVWKIGGNTWERSKTIIRYDNRTINQLRDMMDQMSRDNEELQKALDECNKAKADAAIKKIAVVAPNLVTFKINKSNLSKEARANLGMLAEVIKECDANIVYTITGYADAATGNKDINDRLSKERAQAVYDCLVNEFGVNPDQLRMEAKGGVENMFYDDPALSRAVITRVQ